MFSVKKSFTSAWDLYTSKLTTIVGITALVYFLSALFEGAVSAVHDVSLIGGIIVGVIVVVVGLIIEIGYVKYFLKLLSGGYPTVEDVLRYSRLLWKYFLGMLAFGLIVLGGLLLLIIPGIYLALRFMFVPILIIDKEISVREAFRQSSLMTSGVKWKLLGMLVVLGALQSVVGLSLFSEAGELMYAIGFVMVSPFVLMVFLKAYRHLQGLN